MSLGGLIGFNAGLVATASISLIDSPSWHQLGWMWMGAGIGAAAATPVFLFYAGEDTPPAKRGFLFMGTATTVGLIAGGLFSSSSLSGRADLGSPDSWVAVEHVGPAPMPGGGLGLQVLGRLE